MRFPYCRSQAPLSYWCWFKCPSVLIADRSTPATCRTGPGKLKPEIGVLGQVLEVCPALASPPDLPAFQWRLSRPSRLAAEKSEAEMRELQEAD